MGMLLFDKSGTFVPSDYGLSVGDMLHIVTIGGAHGVFDWLDYVLTASSPASFAVTIGECGAGRVTSNASYSYYDYGAGAPGCVAIYW